MSVHVPTAWECQSRWYPEMTFSEMIWTALLAMMAGYWLAGFALIAGI